MCPAQWITHSTDPANSIKLSLKAFNNPPGLKAIEFDTDTRAKLQECNRPTIDEAHFPKISGGSYYTSGERFLFCMKYSKFASNSRHCLSQFELLKHIFLEKKKTETCM